MSFARAKNPEQRQERVEEILEAAIAMYNEVGYDKTTISKIGSKLDFTRVALYSYFPCKEDIFLLILERDLESMVEDAGRAFSVPCADAEDFINKLTDLMLRHQRMLSLMCIVNTIILKGASNEAHVGFRNRLHELFFVLEDCVKFAFPPLAATDSMHFLDIVNSYSITLYAASLEYKEAQKIAVFPYAGYGTRPFGEQFKLALRLILYGFIPKQEP